MIKSKRLRWARHAACMGDWRGAYRFLEGKPDRRRPLGNTGTDERIILKWIFEMWNVWARTGSIWLRIGTGGGLL
jgi:hypothetical protein